MNWFRRSSRSPSVRRSDATMTNGDNGALLEAFQSHWKQANAVIMQQQQQLQDPTAEQVTAVFRHLDQMMLLLATDVNTQTDHSIGPVLDYLFTENILHRVTVWTFCCVGEPAEQCRRSLLRLYEAMLNQAQYCLLVHKPILLPMLTLLEECSRCPQQADVEHSFVLLLNQICIKITEKDNSPLLEFFFNNSTDEGPPKFLVFTLLIPFLYREGNVGQLARDALLLLIAVSIKFDSVAQFIADHSNFCPVLATGLSALYSSLPRRLGARSDDWHRITDDDIDSVMELRSFYNALEFCNAVVQVGPTCVVNPLLSYIYDGFLVSVLGAALHENSLEELIAATAYLELFFRAVTEPALMRTLLKFVLLEQYDGATLLETLAMRISSNSRLCIVSLALFETLLDLNCEDLMFELVLKYLIPCTHIMISQANNLTDVDYYGRAAQRFLSLIPNCCTAIQKFDISPASSASSLTGQEPSVHSTTVAVSDYDDKSSNFPIVYEFEAETAAKPQELDFLDYLKDCSQTVQRCATACRCWRFPYDGRTPDPTLFREEPQPAPVSTSTSTETSSDVNSAAAEQYSPVDQSPRPIHEMLQSPAPVNQTVQSDSFKRQSSFRKSRTNRYYNPRRGGASNTIGTVPELDLTLGGELEEDPDEQADDAEMERVSSLDSSVNSTPRHQKSEKAPTDYFKLAFDEDSIYGVSDSQEESDIGGGVSQYVLRGWSQVQDLQTFLEVLNRVRVSRSVTQQSIYETIGYISGVYDVMQRNAENELHEQNMVQSNDSGVDVRDSQSANGIEPPAPPVLRITFKSSFSSPNIGPFLTVLLHKLDNMHQNPLFTNLHLTGIIARLACYPQPLITSLLLNNSLVFQPAVRSLHQVLTSLSHKIDSYACTVDSFELLLLRGRKFLLQRERRYLAQQRRRPSRSDGIKQTIPGGGESDNIFIETKSRSRGRYEKNGRLRGLSALFQLPTSPSSRNELSDHTKRRAGSLESSSASHHNQNAIKNQGMDVMAQGIEALKTKNAVYCAIVLEEFLKEMSAISLEHAVSSSEI